MKKIESPEIKEYLEKFIPDTLNNCELFTKTFGKNFAQNNLNKNLNVVYTNELNKSDLGYQCPNDLSITFCTLNENDKPLTVQDFKNDAKLQAVALHESIHAILNKPKNSKIFYRTGMLEGYTYGEELGRGLNEGLTNWICNKANVPIYSYATMTNFINELEIAIGEEKVMKCAKGDINGNISKQLNMTSQDCQELLAIADNVLFLQSNIDELKSITQLLDNPQASKEDKESYRLYNLILYNNLEKNPYIDNTLGSEKEIFDNAKSSFEQELLLDKTDFQNKIYNEYFREDFEKLVQAADIHIDKLDKFTKFYNFVNKEEILELSDIGYFKQSYVNLKERYYNSIISQIEKEFANGTLSGNKLEQLTSQFHQLIQNDDVVSTYSYGQKFYNNVAQVISPNTKDDISDLLYYLDTQHNLGDINKYSISKIGVNNREVSAYLKNGKIDLLKDNYIGKPADKPDMNIDITTEEGEEYQTIMNQFLDLKNDIQTKSPDSTIKILNRLIVVDNNDKEDFYLIDNGQILPANIKSTEKINANLAIDENELPVVPKKNIFTKIAEKIKNSNLLHRKENLEENIEYTNVTNEKQISQKQAFRESISDMTQYSNFTNQNIKVKNHKEKENEKEER